ncbi:hypothetical protein [Actinomadura sp. 21ATH]|uniref:hypothetical protein n=1 Tax=Actinomadura sp. 21ATH TaxID=1735444 RepID=UPI0035C25240
MAWPSALVMALSPALAGCGAAEWHYVKNSGARTYFKVPAGWREIDQRTLDRTLAPEDPDSAAAGVRARNIWSIAYDAHRDPDATHLYGLGSDEPFVYAVIRPLTEAERNAVSLDQLRDAFLPVTEKARQASAQEGAALGAFELLRDRVLTPGGGLRGVRATYNYRLPNLYSLQTFDVTSYSSDQGRLYVLVLRCSARCFRERAKELDTIARSFTVRNDR